MLGPYTIHKKDLPARRLYVASVLAFDELFNGYTHAEKMALRGEVYILNASSMMDPEECESYDCVTWATGN
jgi:hypothetical protein